MPTSFFEKELKPWTIKWIFQRVIVVLFIERRLPQFEFIKKHLGTEIEKPNDLNQELVSNQSTSESQSLFPLLADVKPYVKKDKTPTNKIYLSIYNANKNNENLNRIIDSFVDEVDQINVFSLNNDIIINSSSNKISNIVYSKDVDNILESGRFIFSDEINGFHIIVDDRIIYSDNHISKTISVINKYDKEAIVGLSGGIFNYNSDEKIPQITNIEISPSNNDSFCHLLDTSSIAYHTSKIKISRNLFYQDELTNLYLSIIGQEQKIPFIITSTDAKMISKTETNRFKEPSTEEKYLLQKYYPFQINYQEKDIVLTFSVTTYNRVNYLADLLESFSKTKSDDYKWRIIIADDGSTDDTLNYIRNITYNHDFYIIKNKRRGAVGQTNKIFSLSLKLDYILGFKADDDLLFLNKGWDHLYYNAVKKSDYSHLCYQDLRQVKKALKYTTINTDNVNSDNISFDSSKLLFSYIDVKNAMGAFFTFNKEILTKVGACDEKNFKIRGEWHIDYSNRCCKAGFNNADRFYDCINSDKFLTLQNFEDEENYKCSIEWDEYKHLRTKDELKRRKNIIDNPNRLYIPFNSNQEYTTTNQVFDNIYVINLDRSFSRWEKVMKACRETGINIERFSAVDGKNPEVLKQYERYNSLPLRKNPSFIKKITSSKEYYLDFRHSIARIAFLEEKCNQHSIKSAGAYAYALTYIKILEDAIQKKYQNILILDDDVLLHKNYNFLFRDSFKTLPNNWKLIMLGACQYDWDEWITPFNEHFYHCNGSSVASHAVGISSKMFLQLLHIAKKLDMPIDEGAVTHIQSNYKNDCYINFPNLMIQDTSDSEINSSDSQLDEGTLTNNTYRWNLNNYVKNSKFDILFVMESFPNLPETFIINEICKFIENGYSVGVISLRDPRWNRLQNPKVKKFHLYERTIYLENYKNKLTATEKDTLFNKSLKEIQIEKKYKKYISKYFKNKQREQYKYEALEILKFVINQKPEKIYGHFGNIGDILAPISKITSTPLYTFFHGFDFSRLPKLGWNYSELFKIAKHIFTNTNYSAEKVKNLGCNPKQISVIGIGMETSSYSFRVRKPEQNFKFVTVARLVEKKGLKYSLKAFELLSKEFSNIEYKIIGDGPLRQELQDMIISLGLNDKITLMGAVENHEAIKEVYNSDIFVLSSIMANDGDTEGLGVVLMEAQLMGLPIIATKHNGFVDSVNEGKSGFLVPEKDHIALYERMKYLINHTEEWEKMGAEGRKHIIQNYDSDIVLKKTIDHFN